MKNKALKIKQLLAVVIFLMNTPVVFAAKKNEIPVTLFGQNCSLEGPYSKDVLKMIHEISPEKISPTLTVDQMKKMRTKIAQVKNVHPLIESYKDHLSKRLAALIAFAESIKSTKDIDSFLKNVKEHISVLQYENFKSEAQKILEKSKNKWDETFKQELKLKYETVIEPETEEEFHRATRQASVQYICNFDEGTEE